MRFRQGNTLLEVVVSTMLVGVLLTAALQAAGQTLLAHRKTADRALGQMLAAALASEIQQQSYKEPGSIAPPIGLDAGEAGANRVNYDDVDDYHNLSNSPPQTRDGTALTGAGWTRSVSVSWINPTVLTNVGAESGAKKIVITVSYSGTTVATASLIKTSAP